MILSVMAQHSLGKESSKEDSKVVDRTVSTQPLIMPLNMTELQNHDYNALVEYLPEEERKTLLHKDTVPQAQLQSPFEAIGGLQQHIHQLKEMIVLPLLYPSTFFFDF